MKIYYFYYTFLLISLLIAVLSCTKEHDALLCAQGVVIGQGCLTGSYAIHLDRKNREYGINENLTYNDVVETLNLPDEYKINGTKIYFTFKKPAEEVGKYLTYCTPAPQIVILDISHQNCPIPLKDSQ
jgi:hypothetical protein